MRDEYGAEMDRIMQVFNRHSRKMVAADTAGDSAASARHAHRMMVAAEREDTLVGSRERASKGDTAAPQFTVPATAHMSEHDLRAAARANAGDPDAVEAIHQVLDWRDSQDGDLQETIEQERRAEQDWGTPPSWSVNRNPVTNPAYSPRRQLTAEQRCREDYEYHVHAQYLQAEADCRGAMLNARGRARDVDPVSLFSGPANRAHAYASDELKGWFRDHGRLTYAAYRHHTLGWHSDAAAAGNASLNRGFDNVA